MSAKKTPAAQNTVPNRYGWIPDLPDHRDFVYGAPPAVAAALPPKVDLRKTKLLPAAYNQGRIGSCTANAIAGALQFTRRKEGHSPDFTPARLFIYWNERNLEHTVPLDNGAQIRDGIKVVNQLGVVPESEWTYDDTPANPATHLWPAGAKPAQRPPVSVFTDAKNYQAIGYQRVLRALSQFKGVLASGYPFIFGFTVYASFESAAVAQTGKLNLPAGGLVTTMAIPAASKMAALTTALVLSRVRAMTGRVTRSRVCVEAGLLNPRPEARYPKQT